MAGAIVILVIGILLAAFFRMQILGSSEYALQSENNRLKAIPIPPPRGAIFDRRGLLLAENVPGYSISLLPAQPDSAHATLERLAPFLELDEDEVDRLYDRFRSRPQVPLLVRDNLSFDQVSAVEENRPAFRYTVIETHPRRRYPPGKAVAHVMGYVAEISEEELERPEFEGYEPRRTIGKKGIEREYESVLGGQPGTRYVEVNARGSIVSEFGPRPSVAAQPGHNLALALDLRLQEYADSIFPEGYRGGIVALDPRNGEVMLLYSHPTFDPNLFIGGISSDDWSALLNDPDQPLLNRATSALYPPGSTWKPIVSTIGMKNQKLTIDTRMPTSCRGALLYGNRPFRCWKRDGHGILDLAGAIKQSCNVFFYQAGLRLGLDALLRGVDDLGFNRKTGLDMPTEQSGRFPPSREWYDRRYGPRGWTESVTLNLSIGQGETEQTLMRMVQFYAALATGQSPVIPHLVRNEVLNDRRVDWSLDLPEQNRAELVAALKSVVNEPGGTGFYARIPEWTLAGKTGTAQNPHGEPHSWFVGFAPADDPVIVIAAIVEFGHPDNTRSLAVPMASDIVRRYLQLEGVTPEAELETGAGDSSSPAGGE